MHIAINTRFLLKGKLEGIGWFTNEIVRRIVLANPQHRFTFIFDRPFEESFIYASNVKGVVAQPPARHPFLTWWYFNVSVPRLLKKIKADVFFSPDGFASLTTKVPQCIAIHDLAYVHFPKNVKPVIGKFLRHFTPKFIAKAKKVIAVSSYTKQDIIDTYGTAEDKIQLVYNSANDVFKPLDYNTRVDIKEQYTQGIDYFIYVGSLHPRKNIVRLLEAYRLFKRNTTSSMKLILIGRLAWLTKEIEAALTAHPYKEDIIRFDYMDATDISQLTGAAYAAIYPSIFEGFGIPVLEAIRCNVPIITGNTSSMPEVGGDACVLIDPYDEISIADALIKIYQDENYRNEIIAACPAQAAKFDWNKSAALAWDTIMACISQNQ
jgi:glycosyltransferase involved in cell wall biosynthesis